jgi:hypothetical protein
MQRQGYKNAASNKVTRAKKELLSHQSPARSSFSPNLSSRRSILGAQSVLRFVPEPQTHSSYLTYYSSPYRCTTSVFSWSLFSPLPNPPRSDPQTPVLAASHDTSLASHAPSILTRSGPYLTFLTLPTTAKQDVVAHCFQRLCLYRLLHRAVAVPR